MSSRIKVLITDANYKHTLGAVRSLSKAGYVVDAIGKRISLSGFSRYLGSISYDDRFFNEDHIDKFLDFLSKSSYDVLLPIGARSVRLVSKFRKEIEKYCRTPVPDLKKVEYCLNKRKTCELAKSLGISVPEIYELHISDQYIEVPSDIKYPVFVKGGHEIWKGKSSIAWSKQDLENVLKEWQNFNFIRNYPPFIQEFIPGHGLGFFALYKHGRCAQFFMHRRIRESPAMGGPSTCAVSVFDERLLSIGKKVLDAIEWHGVGMVELRKDEGKDEYYFMEINPKFWGSLDLAIACNVDFPTLTVRMAMGEEIEQVERYPVGVKFHWPFDGEIAHAIEKPSSIPAIARDLLNPAVRSNLWRSDPFPSFLSLFKETYRGAQILRGKIMGNANRKVRMGK